jgi:hypothetical protein
VQNNKNQINSLENEHNNNNNNNKHDQQQANPHLLIERLQREKCDLCSNLKYLKQKIQDIEMRQNEAIRDVSFSFLFQEIIGTLSTLLRVDTTK